MAEIVYDHKSPIRRLRRLLREERRIIYLILFFALVNGVIVLTLPLGIQAILNYILGGRLSSSWAILIVVVTIGLIISGLIQIAQLKYIERLQQRIFAKSAFEFAVRIPKIRIEAMRNRYPPEVINQFFETVGLQKGISKLVVDFPTALLQVFFGLVLIAIYHPVFSLFSLVVLILFYLIFKFTGPKGIVTSLKESTQKYEVAHWLEELARTMGTFKLAGITDLPVRKVNKLVLGYLHHRRSHFGVLIAQFKVLVAFKVLTVSSLLIVGSLLLIENEISLGQFVAAEIVIILIMNSIEKLIMGLEDVYDMLTSLEKLGAITDLPMEEVRRTQPLVYDTTPGLTVATEALTFKYPDTERTVLDRLSLRIESGEKVALIGTEGSGKSTLMQLLSGLYDIYDGRITFNDIPLTALRHDLLRGDVGDNIWQEAIFMGTVRENVCLGKEGVTDEDVREALAAVGAIKGLNLLQDGLNTELLPGGTKLPGSLARKIILARAIVSKPRMLLLEMEVNYLTLEERLKFYEYLFSRHWTALMLTNDEHLIQMVDKIMVLDKGQLVFTGKYDMFKNTGYAQLIR